MIDELISSINRTFLIDDRWTLFADGLLNTVIITVFAVLIGILIGTTVAITKIYSMQTKKLKIVNKILDGYLILFRGTPVVVQLMIWFYIVFATVSGAEILIAILAFGINSGAYLAETIRAGIMAVDKGQIEAARSLGLNGTKTMVYIVLPQAFKNILPVIGNEVIALLKETSIVGYISVVDLTKAGDLIRARTFDAYMPLICVALIYLAMILLLTYFQKKIERKLKVDDTHKRA